MTYGDEKNKIREWYLNECQKISEKFPHVKHQLDPSMEEDAAQRELNLELKKRLFELKKMHIK